MSRLIVQSTLAGSGSSKIERENSAAEKWTNFEAMNHHLTHPFPSAQGTHAHGTAPGNDVTGGNYTHPMVQELRNDGTGRYLVTTATGSHYVFDMTTRTVSRKMAAIAPLVDYLDAGLSQLRRDGELLQLLLLESCAVAASARFWIQVRDDHIVTLRTTSPVVGIVALEPLEA